MTTSKTCFLVLGMHRSGTSAFARIVSFSGAALPKNILGANEGNRTGHWEPEPIVEINDKMLAEFGSRWDDWRAFDTHRHPADRVAYYRAEISRILREEYGDNPLIVLKEPRIARFVGLYADVLGELGYEIYFVHTMRDPEAVAASLKKRNSFPRDLGLLLWVRHVLDAEFATRGKNRVFLSYEYLLQDTNETIRQLADAFPVAFQGSGNLVEKASGFVDKNQQHHAGSSEKPKKETELQILVKRAYPALRALEKDEADGKAQKELDVVRQQFDHICQISGDAFFEAVTASDTKLKAARNTVDYLNERLGRRMRAASDTPLQRVQRATEYLVMTWLSALARPFSQKMSERFTNSANKRKPNTLSPMSARRPAAPVAPNADRAAIAEAVGRLPSAPNVTAAASKKGARPFYAAPVIKKDQPGFGYICGLLEKDAPFVYTKLNHGFWERLAALENTGISRDRITRTEGAEIDERLGIAGSMFAEGGLLNELLDHIRTLPSPEDGVHFVASLAPWPHSDQIEGTPYQNHAQCTSLISHFVPAQHIDNSLEKGFTGHEFKVAAVTGSISRFLDALKNRDVVFIGNNSNRALLDALNLASLTVIEVDAEEARLERPNILTRLLDALEAQREGAARPPVILGAAGGSLTTWLALQARQAFPGIQFVDLGGALAAYGTDTAVQINWTKAYRRQLGAIIPQLGLNLPEAEAIYKGRYGIRDERLVELANAAGVSIPASTDEIAAPRPGRKIPFIENKIYDHQRISELLALSVAVNHHANGGPVSRLLELMVAEVIGLSPDRRVIAVCNGTVALHMACGLHALEAEAPEFRWVASAFNFFSCHVGPLANSTILDCDARGRFDLAALKSMRKSSYDGVIYTNVFAQQSDWDDVAEYCAKHGKKLVIDNATGLLDRPVSALGQDAPIEIISAHHTKPWGVGEGGFIICDAAQEETLRNLANFAARLPDSANIHASNFKISDLAAAAIIDRLERMPHWSLFYKWQERRMHSLMIDAGLGIQPFAGTTQPQSPRAHTPFLSPKPVELATAPGPVTLRKYYRPIQPGDARATGIPNATALYDRIFSLGNAPEMRLVANKDIIEQVRLLVT